MKVSDRLYELMINRKRVGYIIILTALFSTLSGFQPLLNEISHITMPVDKEATDETMALFHNLKNVARTKILFGHEDALAYGVHWEGEDGRSDVKDVTGSHPAVFGWDVGNLGDPTEVANLDTVRFDRMRVLIKEGYKQGGVITISWHMDNPVTGGNSWDTSGNVISKILPGGSHHAKYQKMLDRFAAFVKSLYINKGFFGLHEEPIPVIFRPFHEMTGSWFWWGKRYCSSEEFKRLWRYTADYLRKSKEIHNLLYAYATTSLNGLNGYKEYWKYYPGDNYVDILGFDDYRTLKSGWFVSDQKLIQRFGEQLAWLVDQARQRNKIAALTETGLEGVSEPKWFTQKLLAAFKTAENASGIAYVLLWRNTLHKRKPGHYYVPYEGHEAVPDFKKFREDPLMILGDDLPDLYEMLLQ